MARRRGIVRPIQPDEFAARRWHNINQNPEALSGLRTLGETAVSAEVLRERTSMDDLVSRQAQDHEFEAAFAEFQEGLGHIVLQESGSVVLVAK